MDKLAWTRESADVWSGATEQHAFAALVEHASGRWAAFRYNDNYRDGDGSGYEPRGDYEDVGDAMRACAATP